MIKRAIPEDLLPWALASLGTEGGDVALSIVAGDASNRRYFRLALPGASYILVEAPPATEKNPEFLAVRELLERGWADQSILGESDFKSLRGDPEFEAIVAEVRKRLEEE